VDFDLVVGNGIIVDGTGGPRFQGDVAVKDGRIAAVIRRSAGGAARSPAGGPSGGGDGSGSEGWRARRFIDATGLTVTPGFIDLHSHSDWILPLEEHDRILAPFLEQGVTTVVAGNCGFSPAPLAPNSTHLARIRDSLDFITERPLDLAWGSMDGFLKALEERGVALNVAMLSGHGTMRVSFVGADHAPLDGGTMARMERTLAESLEQGSFGLSLGLGYEPGIFAGPDELERLARVAAKRDRLVTVHLKALSRLSGAYPLKPFDRPHNLRALREMLDLAERTGARLQVSHLIFVGRTSWPLADEALAMIDAARGRGVDVAFDSFPYFCGNTTIYVVYPAWFLRNIERNFRSPLARTALKAQARIVFKALGFSFEDIQVMWGGHPELEQYNGMFFGDIARKMGVSVFDAYLKVSEVSRGKALCLLHKYSGDAEDDSAYRKVLTHPLNSVETDAIVTSRGAQNPAAFGAFPRVIQRYHKELGLLTLEEAVAKMTGRPAERIGLRDRGTIREGNWADLTIFDYDQIRDNTTLTRTSERPSGIRHVFANGREVVRDGLAVTGARAGQVLRAAG